MTKPLSGNKHATYNTISRYLNVLNDAIWWHRSGATLAKVMACCLTAPGHHLNQSVKTGTFFLRCYHKKICSYPMLRADSRFWLVNNREIWSRISRLTSSASDIKTKERHWWRHNGDSDRRPLSLPLRYDLVTLCLYDDLGQINVIARPKGVLPKAARPKGGLFR